MADYWELLPLVGPLQGLPSIAYSETNSPDWAGLGSGFPKLAEFWSGLLRTAGPLCCMAKFAGFQRDSRGLGIPLVQLQILPLPIGKFSNLLWTCGEAFCKFGRTNMDGDEGGSKYGDMKM